MCCERVWSIVALTHTHYRYPNSTELSLTNPHHINPAGACVHTNGDSPTRNGETHASSTSTGAKRGTSPTTPTHTIGQSEERENEKENSHARTHARMHACTHARMHART